MDAENLGASFTIDISNLKAGLSQANKLIRESNSEFKAAAAGLDDWSNSEAGLEAKLKQLKSTLTVQEKVLDAYEKQLEEAGYAEDDMSAAAVELRTKINNQKAAVETTKKEHEKYQQQLNRVKETSNATETASEKLRKEISKQESELKDLSSEYQNAVLEQGKSSEKAKALKTAINNLNGELTQNRKKLKESEVAFKDSGEAAEKASEGFTVMKGALANLVAEGFKKAISAAKDFASEMVQTAAAVKAENSQYAQSFGELVSEADKAVDNVASSTGILRDRLTGTAANIYSFARSSGADTSEAMSLMETALMATADSAAYYDRSLEDSAETLQSFLKGNFANDAALGVSATEFTRNAKATELFGKKYNDLSEIQKQQTLLKMVTDAQKLSGAMGQASRESDGFENVMGNVNETWRQFQARVGTPVLEALIPVMQDLTAKFQEWAASVDWDAFSKKVSDALNKIIDFGKWIAENGNTIIAAIAGIGTAMATMAVANKILSVVKAFQAFKKAQEGATVAQWLLNVAMDANPIGLIIAAIAGLVAAFVVLWNKSETFRNFWIGLWDGIKNVVKSVIDWIVKAWEGVTNFFISVWDGLKNGASKAWEGIKSVFSKVADFFGNIFGAAWEKVKKVFSVGGKIFDGIKDGIVNAFKLVVNGIIKGINKVVKLPFEGLNKILDTIHKLQIAGIKPFEWLNWRAPVPQIPQLAKGGIVSRATTAVVGEAGKEAIVPLENNTEWIDKVAEKLADKQKTVVVNQTNNYSQAHSRYEIYQSKKQTAAAVRLALGV